MTQVMWSVLLLQMVYYHETEGAQGGKGSKQKAPRRKQPAGGCRPEWLKLVTHQKW